MITFPVDESVADKSWATASQYASMYDRSIADPNGFWGDMGKRLSWMKPYSVVKNTTFHGDVSIKWYEDGTLNACVNCVDRHLSIHYPSNCHQYRRNNHRYSAFKTDFIEHHLRLALIDQAR